MLVTSTVNTIFLYHNSGTEGDQTTRGERFVRGGERRTGIFCDIIGCNYEMQWNAFAQGVLPHSLWGQVFSLGRPSFASHFTQNKSNNKQESFKE